MAKSLGDMVVRVVADTEQFNAGINKAHDKYKKFGTDAARIGKQLTTFVTLPLLGAAAATVKFASDAEETAAKFGTAFRDVRAEADKTAKELAEGYGLSTTQAQGLLAATGDLLKGFGATGAEALGLSDQVQRLAVDLASYNNVQGGAAQASAILTKAMLGEREALTTLGIKISDTEVQARLLEDGKKDLEGRALLLAKAEATLQLAMEQSGDAMGDFARTSDSTANRMRILQARMNDAAVQLGNILLPAVNNILGKLIDMATWVTNLTEGQRKTILVIGGLVAAIGPLVFVVGKAIVAFKAIRIAIIAVNAALAANPVGAVVAGTALLVTGIIALVSRLREQKRAQAEVNEETEEYIYLTREQHLAAAKAAIESEIATKRIALAALHSTEQTAAVRREIVRLTEEIRLQKQALDDLNKPPVAPPSSEGEDPAKPWQEWKEQILASTEAQIRQAEVQDELAEKLGESYDLIDAKKKILRDAIQELLDIPESKIDEPFKLADNTIKELIGRVAELGATEEELARKRADGSEQAIENVKSVLDKRREAHEFTLSLIQEEYEAYMDLKDAEAKAADDLAKKEAAARKATYDGIISLVGSMQSLVGGYYDWKISKYEEDSLEYKKAVRDQAAASKLFAIFDIAIKTAQAIVGFLANPSGPAGVALSIAAGAIGLAQAGMVLATPLPALAAGGVVMPRSGGVPVTVAEAGQPEVIFPLDRLGDMLSEVGRGSSAGAVDESAIHLVVNIDSEPILKQIFPATRNRTVLIDAGAVT